MRAYTHTHTHTHMNIPPCRCRHPRVRERLARVWLRQGLPRHQGEAHRRRSGVCVCVSVCLSVSLSLSLSLCVCQCVRAGVRAGVPACLRACSRARVFAHICTTAYTHRCSQAPEAGVWPLSSWRVLWARIRRSTCRTRPGPTTCRWPRTLASPSPRTGSPRTQRTHIYMHHRVILTFT